MIWIILAIPYFVVAAVLGVLLLLSDSEMTIEYGEPFDYFDDVAFPLTLREQAE